MANRETFSSSWGTILTTAGVAIGLGNVWRFPYMMGSYGGSSFLLIYLLAVILLGIPALMCEWALGRYTRRGPLGAFEKAGLPGGRHFGRLLVFATIMAASYYTVILGWVLFFAVQFSFSLFSEVPPGLFQGLMAQTTLQFAFVWICTLLSCLTLYFGVKGGIEKVSTFVTPLFFLLFLVLIGRVVTLPEFGSHLTRFLQPDWSQVSPTSILAAVGQALFSISLGGTFMLIYGSYLRPDEKIVRGAGFTAALDVAAALLASLIIIPPVLIFGIDLASGPPLMFLVLPQVFAQVSGGVLFGTVFFWSVFLVAILSLIGAFEVVVGAFQDGLGWSRNRSLLVILGSQTLLLIPPLLGTHPSFPWLANYIAYSDLIWGSTMQPIGAVICILALTWVLGKTKSVQEIGRNAPLPFPAIFYYWTRYVVPISVIGVLLYGWADFLF